VIAVLHVRQRNIDQCLLRLERIPGARGTEPPRASRSSAAVAGPSGMRSKCSTTPEDHAARPVAVAAARDATVTSTVLKGRPALRLCTINPRTTDSDIALTLRQLAGAGRR
jgi:hypothetical protein